MNTFRLGLVIHAVWLPRELQRMLRSIAELLPMPGINLTVRTVTETEYSDPDKVTFNPAKAKNAGIRTLLDQVDGIACIDCDYIVPPGLFEFLAHPSVQPFHVWVRRRDIPEGEAARRAWWKWLRRPVFESCWGSCNYLSCENWLKVGGWDERTFGWGGDDDVLHNRIPRTGVKQIKIDGLPLMHVEHPLRDWHAKSARQFENVAFVQQAQENYLRG